MQELLALSSRYDSPMVTNDRAASNDKAETLADTHPSRLASQLALLEDDDAGVRRAAV
jgi:hypothetical protein